MTAEEGKAWEECCRLARCACGNAIQEGYVPDAMDKAILAADAVIKRTVDVEGVAWALFKCPGWSLNGETTVKDLARAVSAWLRSAK